MKSVPTLYLIKGVSQAHPFFQCLSGDKIFSTHETHGYGYWESHVEFPCAVVKLCAPLQS